MRLDIGIEEGPGSRTIGTGHLRADQGDRGTESKPRRRSQENLKRASALAGLGQGLPGQGQDGGEHDADQFHALTRFRLDQLWPKSSGRARPEVTMTSDQVQAIVAAVQMRQRMDIEATRKGGNVPKLDQVDQKDIVATREGETLLKLDQVDIKATGEGRPYPS